MTAFPSCCQKKPGRYHDRDAGAGAEYLRVESPSAEVQGHGPNERKIVPGKASVNIASVDPIGHYAIRIRFSDGHDTGIFTWAYLHELARDHGPRWQAYLEALAAKGLRREGPGTKAPRGE